MKESSVDEFYSVDVCTQAIETTKAAIEKDKKNLPLIQEAISMQIKIYNIKTKGGFGILRPNFEYEQTPEWGLLIEESEKKDHELKMKTYKDTKKTTEDSIDALNSQLKEWKNNLKKAIKLSKKKVQNSYVG